MALVVINSPVNANPYDSAGDWVRLVFELLFFVMVLVGAFSELTEVRDNGLLTHFTQAWNLIDALSIAFNFIACALWITQCYLLMEKFDINVSYPVRDMSKWGRLVYDPEHLRHLVADFSHLEHSVSLYGAYLSLCGMNMFFFLLRIFKLLDFQPQMGILTRTVARAMGDLLHFFVLLVAVMAVYVCMGNLVFGSRLRVFSTLVLSMRTTLDMLFGEFGDSEQSMFDTTYDIGLLMIPACMFFYSFMIIVFLVILNFLLAIVVDAFTDVKSESRNNSVSMFQEVTELLTYNVMRLLSNDFRSTRTISVLHQQLLELDRLAPVTVQTDTHAAQADTHGSGAGASDASNDDVEVVEMDDDVYHLRLNAELMRQALRTEPTRAMSKAEVVASERLADTATRVCGHPVGRAEAQHPVMLKEMDATELALFNMQQRLQAMERQMEARDQAMQDTLTALTQHLLPEWSSATLRRRAMHPKPDPSTLNTHPT